MSKPRKKTRSKRDDTCLFMGSACCRCHRRNPLSIFKDKVERLRAQMDESLARRCRVSRTRSRLRKKP